MTSDLFGEEPADSSTQQARRTVNFLMHEEESGSQAELADIPVASDDVQVTLSDVEADVIRFNRTLRILNEFGFDVPAVRTNGDEDATPMSLAALPDLTGLGFLYLEAEVPFFPPFGSGLLQHAFDTAAGSIDGFTTISEADARATFRRRLTDFLTVRIAAQRTALERSFDAWPGLQFLRLPPRRGRPPVTTPGCAFVVTTNSSGLRVHWTGAYITSWNYFNGPTSPVTNTLLAGIYRFGVDHGTYVAIQPDIAVVTLPGTPHVHLNF